MNDKTPNDSDASEGEPNEADRFTQDDIDEAIDQTIQFDAVADPQGTASDIDQTIQFDAVADPQRTASDIDRTIDLDPDQTNNSSVDDSASIPNVHAFETIELDEGIGNAGTKNEGIRNAPASNQITRNDATIEMDARSSDGLVSGLNETIDPEVSLLESGSVTQTIDARTLNENDRRI